MKLLSLIFAFLLCSISFAQDVGTLRWSFLKGNFSPFSAPAVENDGTIYWGAFYEFYALNPDGSKKWEFNSTEWFESPVIGKDGIVYVGDRLGQLYALSPDGTLKWKYDDFEAKYMNRCSPAISASGNIYYGAGDGNLHAFNEKGEINWSYPLGERVGYSSAAIRNGVVYIGSSDSTFYAINEEDGTKKWEFKTRNRWLSSPAVGSDGTVYFACDDSTLYALNPDGTKKWDYFIGGVSGNSPTIDEDGTIYVGNHKLSAINPDGTLKWEYDLGFTFSSATIGKDGTIYIGTNGRGLLAINRDGTLKWKTDGGVLEPSPVITSDSLIIVAVEHTGLLAYKIENNSYANSSWPKFQHDNQNSGNVKFPVTTILENDISKFNYLLSQNYPNPFNPTTTILYSIPNSEFVELKVYDLLGKEVANLVNEFKQSGNHSVNFDGSNLSSGIYFYTIKAGSFIQSKKLVLLK